METYRLRIVVFMVVILFGVGAAAAEKKATLASIPDSNKRLTILISDLHIGPGKDDKASGKWRNTEDFRWEEEFSEFLDFAKKEGKGNADLIILGDMLELWQSANMDCTGQGITLRCTVRDCEHGDKELGCTEGEALVRVKRILLQHKAVFESLNTFASQDTNRIIILPGNHDAALLYPGVAREVISAIVKNPVKETDCGANSRVCISKKGYWISSDGRIYADHGHSFDKANRFVNWPNPFVKRKGKTYLERPFGEQMVQQFYNRYEERFPILDNLEKETDGITLGFQTEGVGLIDDFAEFAKFLLLKISWKQFWDFTGEQKEGQPPKWDLDKIIQEDSPQFLVDSIPSGSPLRIVAEESLRQKKFILRPSQLTRDELQELCDYKMLRKEKGDTAVVECPRTVATTGRIFDKIADREKENLTEHLFTVYEARRAAVPTSERFSFYLYGHTHQDSTDSMTLQKDDKTPWSLTVINTGAFQRVVSKDQLEQIQEQRRSQGGNLEDRDILTTLKPEDLPACYTFVRIDPYTDAPNPTLLYWVKGKGGKWMQNGSRISP